MVSIQSDVIFLFHVLLYSRLFLSIIRFCYKPKLMLSFSLFYNAAQDFTVLNVLCSHVWIITTPAIYTLLLCFQDTFIPLHNPVVFYSTYTFIMNMKTRFKDI
jgi:hypothetical protein